jgi:hypothetical protein
MKIKIDKSGYLTRSVGPLWQEQNCPYSNVAGERLLSCGTWCPHFGEPDNSELRLCHGTIIVGEIVDERGKA